MDDLLALERVMQQFDSVMHLEQYLKKNKIEQRHRLRHDFILDVLDDDRIPKGASRDAYIAVLNVFGDAVKDDIMPSALPIDVVRAKAADDLGVSERSFKPKLQSLITAGHLKLVYGKVVFPAGEK
jgi:hypothetical protein